MKNNILFIKAEQDVEVLHTKIFLQDIVKLFSVDKKMVSQLNKIVVMVIKANEDTEYMFSILKVIELISKEYPDVEIINLGETDFVLSYKVPKKKNKLWEYGKAAVVGVIIFFGAVFTIMTFNTDVSVSDVFNNIYLMVTGAPKKEGTFILEIAYVVGLPLGNIVFYNHFSKIKIHNDPTPIQIQMRLYEEDANKALLKDAAREGKTIDAD